MIISIITVCFNSEKTIEESISSVLRQTAYPYIEYIIIDGGSTDKTLKIIDNYSDKISFFSSERDLGIYDAMNKGIKVATGDVIGFLNSDDLYSNNNIIDKIISQFTDDNNLDILYGDLVYVRTNDTTKIVRKWVSKAYYHGFFEHGNVPPHPSLFVKRKVYTQVGLFNLDYKLAADYELMLRIFKTNLFVSKYINCVLVKMRMGGATNNSLVNVKNQNIEILHSWKRNGMKVPFLLMPLRLLKRISQFIR